MKLGMQKLFFERSDSHTPTTEIVLKKDQLKPFFYDC